MNQGSPGEQASRIGPLATLPLFLKLTGQKAVVVGTSEAAGWKAELLAAAGAEVEQLSRWTERDLGGAAIAIADLPDADEAGRFRKAARMAGAVVNVIDKPEFSDVQFGTIVNRSPIVIGISTDGAAPMLGQSIRARIEAVLPPGLSSWAGAAKSWRARLKQRLTDFADRRSFWERFVTAAWREPERDPSEGDFEQLLQNSAAKGRVIFIADPGDAELLTLKAARALQIATVIIHDGHVGPEVLELARREARRILAWESGRQAIEMAIEGDIVARVTNGADLEEIADCKAAGLEVIVVPGVARDDAHGR
ncbi:MAG TPA: NAD(P)-dependent oxidoreductase [Sphingomicrobium sp.]